MRNHLDGIINDEYTIPRKGDRGMLHTNPIIVINLAQVSDPNTESVLVELDGYTERLAIEKGGTVIARGPGLQYHQYVPWTESQFSGFDPQQILLNLRGKLRRVWVHLTSDNGEPRAHEFESWKHFVRWLGRPSDLLEKLSWHDCHPLNVYVPKFLNAEIDKAAESRKVSKRKFVVTALERYLDSIQ